MKSKPLLIFVPLFALVFSACERAPSDTSRLSLQLPVYSKAAAGALSCDPCLKGILVNVDGDDFKTISFQQQHPEISEAATQLAGDITLEVPAGPGRKVQILALYRAGGENGEVKVQYGSSTVDLSAAEVDVPIQLSSVGEFKDGSIMGRYLTGNDSGPTGRVNIEFSHPESGLTLSLMAGEILNGWFNFYAAHDQFLTYRLAETGETLLKPNLSTERIKKMLREGNTASELMTNGRVAHITRAPLYWIRDPYEKVEHAGDLVYGFFGSETFAGGKKVCLQDASGISLDRTSISASSTDYSLSYSASVDNSVAASADATKHLFYGSGGSFSGCNSMDQIKSYTEHQISIGTGQLNGNGNDHARAIAGAFTYFLESTDSVLKYKTSGTHNLEFQLMTLPGLFNSNSAPYDTVRLFKKANAANGGYDDVRCDLKWLDSKGFTEVTDFEVQPELFVTIDNNIKFRLNSIQNGTDGYIVCPAKSGINALVKNMNGMGGMYLGALGPTQYGVLESSGGGQANFAQTEETEVSAESIVLTNTGNFPINDLDGAFSAITTGSDFEFTGGSFPGSPGTCGATLAPAASCTIYVNFAPTASGNHSAVLTLTYDSGIGPRTTNINLYGEAIPYTP